MNERDIARMRRDRLVEKQRIAKEKLIPKKPVPKMVFVCPHCKEIIQGKPEKCRCSQTLDWSDIEPIKK